MKGFLPDGQTAILLAANYQLPEKNGLTDDKYNDVVADYKNDLLGVGSKIGSPRGPLNASINNILEAVTAGIGTLTYNGNVFTDEFWFKPEIYSNCYRRRSGYAADTYIGYAEAKIEDILEILS